MSDEFEDLNSRIPDFSAALAMRLAQKQGTAPTPAPAFDPYKEMLKRKEAETAPIDPSTVKQWPDADIKRLQDYCESMGIVGFSCGRMSPTAALAMLKSKLGDNYTEIPLEERVPAGCSPISPYSKITPKKQILHG